MNIYKRKKKNSFTLIELLVVIAIIGLLSSVILVSLSSVRAKARDSRRKSDIAQIRKALELYYADNEQYPLSGGAASPNGGWSNSGDGSWDTLKSALLGYIALPSDPINDTTGWSAGGKYNYDYYSLNSGCAGQWYMLVYKLEKPDISRPGVKACNDTNFNYANTITSGMCQKCQ
ncbi:MAG: type II secretion system protein [Parcubacteria group bacterium]|nr:MAG: type II secretion system protein [Parcubacteria group bacterium]